MIDGYISPRSYPELNAIDDAVGDRREDGAPKLGNVVAYFGDLRHDRIG